MEYYVCRDPETELVHWGIKGMKWGVRRYQNKDGSLTPAGKKRVAAEKNALKERERSIKTREKEKAERVKLDAKKAELDARERELNGGGSRKVKNHGKKNESNSDASTRMKPISEMSNKELQEYTTRMRLEKEYYDAQRNLAAMNPKQVSKGRKYAEKLLNEAIMPAVTNAGKNYLNKMMNQAMGIDDKDTLSELKKTFETLDYKQKIDKIKNPDRYLSEEDKNKRQQRDFEAETRAANREGYATVTDKAKADKAAAADKAAKDAAESARVANNAKSEEYYNSTYSKSTGERTDTNPNTNRGMSVFDTYKNTSYSSISTDVRNSGKTRVDTLLDKNGDKIFDFYTAEDDD